MSAIRGKESNKKQFLVITIIAAFLIGVPIGVYTYQEEIIVQKEEEIKNQSADIQELKQTLHMIQARNEGIKYIDELPEGELPWE